MEELPSGKQVTEMHVIGHHRGSATEGFVPGSAEIQPLLQMIQYPGFELILEDVMRTFTSHYH